jgi:hygromycin-B 4-O-kinase
MFPLRAGEWSKVFGFRKGGVEYVARFSKYREDFDKDAHMARYSSAALPIPPITEIGETADGYYAISKRVTGGYIDDLDAEGMRRVLPSLWAALDAMRAIDLSSYTGFGGWNRGRGRRPTWRDALLTIHDHDPGRGGEWREALARSPVGTAPYDAALERMRPLVDHCPEIRHVIHDDLLHFNVLVAADGITAVLDWGSSTWGDFLYELGMITFWWPYYTRWTGIDIRAEAQAHFRDIGLEIPDFDARLRCYQLRTGLSGLGYQAWRGETRWDDLAWTARRIKEI